MDRSEWVTVPREPTPEMREAHAMYGDTSDWWNAVIAAAPPPPAEQGSGEMIEAAEAMGARGGPASEPERQAFEAWMRGHCWALCATWNGTEYRSDAEQGGRYFSDAARTRMLWAAWRDRAALSQRPAVDEAWRQKAAEWLESKAVEQEANNQRWPDHAAAYGAWRDRPNGLRMLALQVLAGQQQGGNGDA